MKKLIIAALAAASLALCAGCGQKAAQTEDKSIPINVTVNGNELSVPEQYPQPFISGKSVYLPMEVFFDAVSAQAQWDKDTGTITVSDSGQKQLTMNVNSSTMVYDNEEFNLGAPVMVKDSKVVLPVEGIVMAMGGGINWNGSTKTLSIDYKAPAYKSGPAYKSVSEVNAAIGGAYEVRELVNPMYDIIGYNYSDGRTDIIGEWTIGSGGGFVVAMDKGSRDHSDLIKAEGLTLSENYVAENGKEARLYKSSSEENKVTAIFEHGGYTFCISMTGNDWEPTAAVKEIIKNIESTY